ncbi:MAG: hypothetical protein ABIJ09_15875 [Pseudomonadota bacterium]
MQGVPSRRSAIACSLVLVLGAALLACPQPAGTCSTQAHCATGELCIEGRCRQACASSAVDCPSDQQCHDGVCLPLGNACSSPADCLGIEACVQGLCHLLCSTSVPCPGSQQCMQGSCIAATDAATLDGSGSDQRARDSVQQDSAAASDLGMSPDGPVSRDAMSGQDRADASAVDIVRNADATVLSDHPTASDVPAIVDGSTVISDGMTVLSDAGTADLDLCSDSVCPAPGQCHNVDGGGHQCACGDEVCASGLLCVADRGDAGVGDAAPVCCADGLTNCSSTCVDTAQDTRHCGACGHSCAFGESCSNGSCVCGATPGCNAGSQDCCGGVCRDVLTDPLHCGPVGTGIGCSANCVSMSGVDCSRACSQALVTLSGTVSGPFAFPQYDVVITDLAVTPFDGINAGVLLVTGANIQVTGTLDATGAGYGGGGGGGGGAGGAGGYDQDQLGGEGGNAVAGSIAGMAGTGCVSDPGSSPDWTCEILGSRPGGNGGKGGGSFGGSGGTGTTAAGAGGYLATGVNGDSTTDSQVWMGGGGGGGRGGRGADGWNDSGTYCGGGGGGGAGAGYRGGGAILLVSSGELVVTGSILTRAQVSSVGASGGNGHASMGWEGGDGGRGGHAPQGGGEGGTGGMGWSACSGAAAHSGTTGAAGGGGAGGGILLQADVVNIDGVLDARGTGDQLANSGTIKIFWHNSYLNNGDPATIRALIEQR